MTDDNWKTLRVPVDAWEEAKAQKEEHDRTWGEQIVCDNTSTNDGKSVEDSVVDTEELAREVAKQLDYAELANLTASEVAEALR